VLKQQAKAKIRFYLKSFRPGPVRPAAAAPSRFEMRDDARRDGLRFHFGRIGGIRRGPDPRLAALDRHRAGDKQPMLDVEARTAEFADLRRHFNDVAEAGRRQKAGAGVDQRNPDDAEGRREIRRLNPERGFEQRPRAPIEEFEKAGVEDNAGGVALSLFDRKLPAADEICHCPP
jgi:hypothetical protein